MHSSNLYETIFSERREYTNVEGTFFGGILLPTLKMNKSDVFIYGAGGSISPLISYMESNGIFVKGVIDRDEKKRGKKLFDRIPIIHTTDVNRIENPENTWAIINTIYFEGMGQCEICNALFSLGIKKYYRPNQWERKEIKRYNHPPMSKGRIEYYRQHVEELDKVYDLFEDDESREIMREYIRAYIECGTYHLPTCKGRVKYFFGKELPSGEYEELYTHLDNEVWVNCGASIGENIFLYFAEGLQADKIYAFEGDKETYKKLCDNLVWLPSHLQNKVVPINEFLGENTRFDTVVENRKITFINADIEGSELDALKSMTHIIQRDRPVLAISAYHRASDFIDFASYFESTVSDYCYVLRKYDTYAGDFMQIFELVFYAIPKERRVEVDFGNTRE